MKDTHHTRTLNDDTYATNPGQISLAHDKLRILRPDLYGLRGMLKSLFVALRLSWPERIHIEEQLQNGDSRAAIVVSTQPLLIAAYTDELDCVAILRFPDEFLEQYQLNNGTRLLTVNCYGTSPNYGRDLVPGPKMLQRYTGFHPIIAEFVSHDTQRIASRKSNISEDEWQRAYTMGIEYLKHYPGVERDGRPIYSRIPAKKNH